MLQPRRSFAPCPAHPPMRPSNHRRRSHLRSHPFFCCFDLSLLPPVFPPTLFPVTKLAVSLSICWFFLQRPCTCSHLLSCWPPLLPTPPPPFISLSLSLSRSLPLSQYDAARPVPGSASLSVIQSICRQVNFVYSGWPKPLFFFKEH